MAPIDGQAVANGAVWFLLSMVLGMALLVLFLRLYQASTPYDERRLVGEGNSAAAIAVGGALIGFALPLASAIRETTSPLEFAIWGVIAGIIQIVAPLVVRSLVIRDFAAKIEAGNVATGIFMAALSIGIGLINAASMTY